MEKQKITETKLFKFALPIFIVWSIISIFKAGYLAGKWLFVITH